MKAKLYNLSGEAKEIELPKVFSEKVREDVAQRYFENEKEIQPYAPFILAGKQKSASGKIKHGRRLWKTAYGHGISRVPRKILWRRGKQFYWVGATISSARGGRRSHPPRVEHFVKIKKTNKKEAYLAMVSGIAATASINFIKRKYENIKDIKAPIIVEEVENLKAKQIFELLEKILNENYENIMPRKIKNSGRGKMRGRKYKKTAGLLIVTGNQENLKVNGVDVRKVNEIQIADLYPLGRLTIYTEKALKDINEVYKI